MKSGVYLVLKSRLIKEPRKIRKIKKIRMIKKKKKRVMKKRKKKKSLSQIDSLQLMGPLKRFVWLNI